MSETWCVRLNLPANLMNKETTDALHYTLHKTNDTLNCMCNHCQHAAQASRQQGSSCSFIHSFLGAPLWVCSTKRRHILQSGRFWATSIASFRERFSDSRSCWVVFIHVVRGHPGGLLQFSKEEAVKICLASDLSGIRAMWPNRERRRAWTVAKRCGCMYFSMTMTPSKYNSNSNSANYF